jgi:hypothetical protein
MGLARKTEEMNGMNLDSRKFALLTAAFAWLVLGGVWVGVSAAGPSTDTDSDTVADYHDNCTAHSNTTQIDTDGDGYGTRCDADYDNSGSTGGPDFGTLVANFGKSLGTPGWNPETDHDGSNATGGPDYGIMVSFFGLPPGPSSCAPSGCI